MFNLKPRIKKVEYLKDYKLKLTFNDKRKKMLTYKNYPNMVQRLFSILLGI